jgi:hypothetical protein
MSLTNAALLVRECISQLGFFVDFLSLPLLSLGERIEQRSCDGRGRGAQRPVLRVIESMCVSDGGRCGRWHEQIWTTHPPSPLTQIDEGQICPA